MIEKAVEILLQKLIQPRTRKEKADDDVKERLVFLHECLVECHKTYLQYSSNPSRPNLKAWRKAVLDLSCTLDAVGLALSSFSPKTFNYVSRYVSSEYMPTFRYKISDEEKELESTVVRLELLRDSEPEEEQDDEFKEATTRLREFMKEHMSLGEIQKAQERFKAFR